MKAAPIPKYKPQDYSANGDDDDGEDQVYDMGGDGAYLPNDQLLRNLAALQAAGADHSYGFEGEITDFGTEMDEVESVMISSRLPSKYASPADTPDTQSIHGDMQGYLVIDPDN